MSISYAYFCLGFGAEWRFGINRNHGLAIQAGYQGGQGKYKTKATTYSIGGYTQPIPAQEETYKEMPFFLLPVYSYYF